MNLYFRHYKGGLYKLLHIARRTDGATDVLCIYQNKAGEIFARPAQEFFGFTDSGSIRFETIDAAKWEAV